MSTTQLPPKKAAKPDCDLVISLLSRVYPISDGLKQEAYANMVAFDYPKGHVLVKEYADCHYVYFIKKGALMGCTTHKKKHIVTYISVENEFVSSISGLYGRSASKESIIAVEDVSLVAIHSDVLQGFFMRYFELNFIFRVMLEQYYMDAQERAHIVRVGSAKERYLYFTQTKPGYMERLPSEFVASLLDMKPLTLVKIQKQYALSLKKDKEMENTCKQIERYMAEKQAFKNKDLSLKSLSEALGLSPHKLSSILNNQYQQNFMDFVNTYRIVNLKEQLTKPGFMQSYTIETLAHDAGFASRSAFYNSFKKLVGQSPSAYVKNLGY